MTDATADAANAAMARYVGAQRPRKSVWRHSPHLDAVPDARPAKMPDPRRYGMAAEMYGSAAEMRHATGRAAPEMRNPSTAKMRHAATAKMRHAATAKMTDAAAADVNAAAAAAPMGELRLSGLRREEK
jgi:hypothetical protein